MTKPEVILFLVPHETGTKCGDTRGSSGDLYWGRTASVDIVPPETPLADRLLEMIRWPGKGLPVFVLCNVDEDGNPFKVLDYEIEPDKEQTEALFLQLPNATILTVGTSPKRMRVTVCCQEIPIE